MSQIKVHQDAAVGLPCGSSLNLVNYVSFIQKVPSEGEQSKDRDPSFWLSETDI